MHRETDDKMKEQSLLYLNQTIALLCKLPFIQFYYHDVLDLHNKKGDTSWFQLDSNVAKTVTYTCKRNYQNGLVILPFEPFCVALAHVQSDYQIQI